MSVDDNWDKVGVGKRIEVELPEGAAEGEVIEVGGRRLRPDGAEPGWAKVRLDDETEVYVSQASLGQVIG